MAVFSDSFMKFYVVCFVTTWWASNWAFWQIKIKWLANVKFLTGEWGLARGNIGKGGMGSDSWVSGPRREWDMY